MEEFRKDIREQVKEIEEYEKEVDDIRNSHANIEL